MAVEQQQKPKDPNWVCTFSLVKNSSKESDKHPDLVHPDSEKMNKSGKPFKKNFTINGVWHEASAYFQKDKSLKVISRSLALKEQRALEPKKMYKLLLGSLSILSGKPCTI